MKKIIVRYAEHKDIRYAWVLNQEEPEAGRYSSATGSIHASSVCLGMLIEQLADDCGFREFVLDIRPAISPPSWVVTAYKKAIEDGQGFYI